MKKFILPFAGFLALIVLMSSCAGDLSIQKRRYNKGYYISMSDKGSSKAETASATETASQQTATISIPVNSPIWFDNEESGVRIPAITGVPAVGTFVVSSPIGTTTAITAKSTQQESPVKKAPMAIRALKKQAQKPVQPGGDANLIVMVILALLLPPLAVYLAEGTTSRFWLDLILALLGVGILAFSYYSGLLWLIAVIIALLAVLK